MSTKTKLALALALVLSTSSAVLAAPRYSQVPAGEQNWMDRASNGGHAEGDTNGF
jgi:cytochrome c-type biogenesis protein CcmH/NrfG